MGKQTTPRGRMKQVKALITRWPLLAALPAYVAGVIWRWNHIYVHHDPRATIYSDMYVYITAARRIAMQGYELTPLDVTHPPATSWLFSQFYQADPSYFSLMLLQVVVSSLIPLAVGALAWVAFDQRAAAWSVAISSGYYYYVEYGGFFLSEIYLMLLVPATMALYLLSVRAQRWQLTLLYAALAGLLFFAALAFKTHAAPAILGFCGIHWLFTSGATRRIKTMALGTLCLAALPGMAVIGSRCTSANRGNFCLTSNKAAADFLLGHYDRIHSIRWTDSQFGSPAAQQHLYEHVPQVGFSITDGEQNFQAAWNWILASKGEALVLSVQHVFDLFSSNVPWPTIWTAEWPTAQAIVYLFFALMMLPSVLLLFDIARFAGFAAMFRSIDFAIISVLFGVMLAVFIATGESRNRLPFDCAFIVLGVQFYRRMLARHGGRLAPRPLETACRGAG